MRRCYFPHARRVVFRPFLQILARLLQGAQVLLGFRIVYVLAAAIRAE